MSASRLFIRYHSSNYPLVSDPSRQLFPHAAALKAKVQNKISKGLKIIMMCIVLVNTPCLV